MICDYCDATAYRQAAVADSRGLVWHVLEWGTFACVDHLDVALRHLTEEGMSLSPRAVRRLLPIPTDEPAGDLLPEREVPPTGSHVDVDHPAGA